MRVAGEGRGARPGQWRLGGARQSDPLVFGDGTEVYAGAEEAGMRFLLVSGMPLREPVAWYGPIVMNTRDELRRAFQELKDGTFIRTR